MRLFRGAIFASIGLWALPVAAQSVMTYQVDALVEALRRAAPQTGRTDDGLYSDWQVKLDNITSWAKFCQMNLTVAQFDNNPEKARELISCVVEDLLKEEYTASGNNEEVAVLRSAAWWMTGDSTQYNSGTTAEYAGQVLKFYREERSPN